MTDMLYEYLFIIQLEIIQLAAGKQTSSEVL